MAEAIAYRIEAVPALRPGTIATAAVMSCRVSGEILSGMGGGGDYISPAVRDWLISPAGASAYAEHAQRQQNAKA